MICTQNTERCNYNRYDKKKISPPCCHNNLRNLLFYFDKLARKKDLVYFLDFGTLLGCARDGKIIPYDTDIDISMLFDDHKKLKEMKPFFKRKGYCLKRQRDNKTFYRLFYSDKNFLHIDIHLRILNNENIYYSHYSIENWGINKSDLFPLKYKTFENKKMPIPKEYKKYLEHGYGKDCIKIPQRKGQYKIKY